MLSASAQCVARSALFLHEALVPEPPNKHPATHHGRAAPVERTSPVTEDNPVRGALAARSLRARPRVRRDGAEADAARNFPPAPDGRAEAGRHALQAGCAPPGSSRTCPWASSSPGLCAAATGNSHSLCGGCLRRPVHLRRGVARGHALLRRGRLRQRQGQGRSGQAGPTLSTEFVCRRQFQVHPGALTRGRDALTGTGRGTASA